MKMELSEREIELLLYGLDWYDAEVNLSSEEVAEVEELGAKLKKGE